MTTALAPDETTWAFQDLEVPCEIIPGRYKPCGRPAEWIGRWLSPCCRRIVALLCDHHKAYLTAGEPWQCVDHGDLYTPSDVTVEAL